MSELDAFIPVINGHIDYFGIKKKKTKSWYPKNKQDIDEFYADFRVSNNLLELRNLAQVAQLIISSEYIATFL